MRRLGTAALLLTSALGAACCKRPGGSSNAPLKGDDGVGKAPQSLDFGNVPVGQVKSLQLSLSNVGGVNLDLSSVAITGANAADFQFVNNLPKVVSPSQTVSATVQFSPQSGSAETAAIDIVTDSNTTPTLTVSLTGAGIDVQVCITPTPVDFGNVQVLGTPASQTVTVSNCGKSPLDLSWQAVEGPQASDFTASGQSGATLQPGQSQAVQIAYWPHQMGPSTADLPYGVCQGCPAQQIDLTGVGVDGQLVFAPSPVNFGSWPVGASPPPTQTLTATNTGTEPLTVTRMGTYNANGIFTLSNGPALPATLQPMGSVGFTVTYVPSGQAGGDSDEVLATWTVADTTVAVRTAQDQLSGNQSLQPCSLALSPSSLSFGNVAPNSPSTKQLSLMNKGLSACQVAGIALGSGTDPYFSIPATQPLSFALQPGSTATVAVTFSPASSSPPLKRTGTLTFQTGDPANPNATVPLSAVINNVTVYSAGWPKWHFDNGNTGQTQADTSSLTGNVAWKFQVGAPGSSGGSRRLGGSTYIASPVVDQNGNVYQVALSGMLDAVDPTGKSLWGVQLSDPSQDSHPSTPAILANGSMFVMSGSDAHNGGRGGGGSTTTVTTLYFISPQGAVEFSEPFGEDGFDACPGLGNDGTLFEADDDGPASSNGSGDPYSALAFSANGSSVSQIGGLALPISTESERFGIVIANDDSSYWGNNGQFFAVSPPASGFQQVAAWPASGVTLATAPFGAVGSVVSDLALDLNNTGNVFAYSAWEALTNSLGLSVQGTISALSPANGAVLWTVALPTANLPAGWAQLQSDVGNAAPAVASDGTVYVGNGDGLRAIDGATGSVKWLFQSANVSSSPAIGGDGTIFYGADDGNFYAVTPAGSLRFKVTTGGPISSSPAIGPDGTVFFTSDDGYLYSVK
ncbi:MAG: choice-of-anchor D domain-containing protein [Myxococcales bacterium]